MGLFSVEAQLLCYPILKEVMSTSTINKSGYWALVDLAYDP
jgi:hypothetical protein